MDNFILNPKTQRLIKIGGKTYLKLVNEGLIEKTAQKHELSEADSKEEGLVAKKCSQKSIQTQIQRLS